MPNVRTGNRVQVKPGCDCTLVTTGQRTTPGTVTAIYGTGADASVAVDLDCGQPVPYRPGELEILP